MFCLLLIHSVICYTCVSESVNVSSSSPPPCINKSRGSHPLVWVILPHVNSWLCSALRGGAAACPDYMASPLAAADWPNGTQARGISPCVMWVRSRWFSAPGAAEQGRRFCKKEETSTQERQRGEARREGHGGPQCPGCRTPS